jgi:hypothetical protein
MKNHCADQLCKNKELRKAYRGFQTLPNECYKSLDYRDHLTDKETNYHAAYFESTFALTWAGKALKVVRDKCFGGKAVHDSIMAKKDQYTLVRKDK